MKILKFGGTSVQNAVNISKTISIISEKLQDDTIVVVVSAFGGITNKLIEAGNLAAESNISYKETITEISTIHQNVIQTLLSGERKSKSLEYVDDLIKNLHNILHGLYLIRELSPRSLDLISSYGERLSAFIIAQALQEKQVKADYLDAQKVIKTDKTFGAAKINFDVTQKNIRKAIGDGSTAYIVTGFIASTADDETITLGRGGSDYSAAVFAQALKAEILEIWTDVDGMMTADPRKVKKAYPLAQVTYAEAMELSHFGAKVLEPRTVIPAMAENIPVIIKNTFNPTAPGTYISNTNQNPEHRVQGISSIDDVSLITVQGSGMIGEAGISMRLFKAIAKGNINVILITQGSSEHSITFAVSPQEAHNAKELLEDEFEGELETKLIETIRIKDNLSVIAAVGENMKNIPGVSGRFFNALDLNGINVHAIAQGASELNISVVVSKTNTNKALNALHEAFFLSNDQTLNVFIVGTGVIGNELINQIAAQHTTLIAK